VIKLIGAKLKRGNDLGYILFWMIYKLVFQIDCLGNGRKEICSNGR